MARQQAKAFRIGALVAALTLGAQAVQAERCETTFFGTELVDDIEWCASSVLPASRVSNYSPDNLNGWTEGLDAAWCEGAPGAGTGEWFEFRPRPRAMIREMVIFNGYQKSAKSFARNARAAEVVITTDSGLRLSARLRDSMEPQTVELPGWHDVGAVRVTITRVYPGTHYQDLCISAFGIDFEAYRTLQYQMEGLAGN